MAKKAPTQKRDSKTGKFVSKHHKGPISKGKSATKKNASGDKVGTNATGAKNRRDKK